MERGKDCYFIIKKYINKKEHEIKKAVKERKSVSMKKTFKVFIAGVLCAAAIITSISAGTGTVSAAGKKSL